MKMSGLTPNGLLRTDYSDRRGGALGYITNDKYRNGNFVDRILSDMVLKTTRTQLITEFIKGLNIQILIITLCRSTME